MALSNVFSVFVLASSIVELQSTPARLLSFQQQNLCTTDVQVCADGTEVSRDPKLNCHFPPCTVTPSPLQETKPIMCASDVKVCLTSPRTWVSRDPLNDCAFPPCPDPEVCTHDVQQCPDGSSVSRDPANNCEFERCSPAPSRAPSQAPSNAPTEWPTTAPSNAPFNAPSQSPTAAVVIDEVGCGIDHCNIYFDGCGMCFCGTGSTPFCTKRACNPDMMRKPYCAGCETGYILNQATNKCEAVEPVVKYSCGDFDNCVAYNDGCNDWRCGPNDARGFPVTNLRCFARGTPKCNLCAEGYTLIGGVCVSA